MVSEILDWIEKLDRWKSFSTFGVARSIFRRGYGRVTFAFNQAQCRCVQECFPHQIAERPWLVLWSNHGWAEQEFLPHNAVPLLKWLLNNEHPMSYLELREGLFLGISPKPVDPPTSVHLGIKMWILAKFRNKNVNFMAKNQRPPKFHKKFINTEPPLPPPLFRKYS